jgi:serine/threonine protein kinase
MFGVLNYTSAIDMWAVGCVLYELYEGRALFKNVCEIGCLFKILEWTGSPTMDSWPEIFYVGTRFSVKYPKFKKIVRIFKRMPKKAQDLLDKLLVLNSEERLTAREALNHAYFK